MSPVSSRAERERVYDLRAEVYRGRSDYLLREGDAVHPAQDRFDRDAFLFAAYLGGETVASCRFTPPRGGAWEASESAPVPRALASEGEHLLQISRVLVRGDLRRLGVSEVILRDACRWLLAHTEYRAYFALCLPPLARFYAHFGASAVPGADVRLPDRGNQTYRFVRGTLAGSARAIDDYLSSRPLSLTTQEAAAAQQGATDAR